MGFSTGVVPYPVTAAELLNPSVALNGFFPSQPYDFRRYGALFNNSADDTTAINNGIVVAGTSVNGSDGATCTGPTGVSFINTMIQLVDRVHVVGQNKRGTVFKPTGGWSVGAAWNSGTAYAVGQYATSGGALYICTVAHTNHVPPNTSFWLPISQALFYANNGFTAGVGNSTFDSTMERLTVDANNTVNLGCILSSAWQEDCGLRGVLLTNFGDYGVRFQDGFGGSSLAKIVDAEIFGGTIVGQTITGITAATNAVVTVNTVSVLNPFTVNGYVAFTGVGGMTQINGLVGKVTAVGGASGAWTATVNINSSAFSAFTSGGNAGDVVGIDLSNPMGLVGGFMLDVSNTSITGGVANIGFGIACNGNSLLARQYHVEFCEHGLLVDGVGHITIDDMTGSITVTNLVTIASNFVGTLRMRNCRRNGATNFIKDLRIAQIATLGAITGGSLYTNGTYTNVPLTGGTGIDAQATITVSGAAVTVVTVTQPGTGYVVTDALSAAAANIGGTGSGFSVPVASIFTGLGTITGQDCPDVLVNSGDVGNILITGISAQQNISSAGSIITAQTPSATSSILALQADNSSAYVGTTNANKNTVITSANNLSVTVAPGKQVSFGAPTTAGASHTLPAGTTTVEPQLFTAGTNLTTAAAGAVEYDGTCQYFTPFGTSRGVNMTEFVQCISGAYTLTSQTAAQKLLNATANGAITLPIGVYEFECAFSLTAMSASSGSFGFAIGGSSTHTDAWWAVADKPAALATAAATATTTYNTAANVAIAPTGTNTVGWAQIRGIIRVTVAGTIIPQVSLGVAAAAVVGANSFFRILPVGPSGFTTVGQWT